MHCIRSNSSHSAGQYICESYPLVVWCPVVVQANYALLCYAMLCCHCASNLPLILHLAAALDLALPWLW